MSTLEPRPPLIDARTLSVIGEVLADAGVAAIVTPEKSLPAVLGADGDVGSLLLAAWDALDEAAGLTARRLGPQPAVSEADVTLVAASRSIADEGWVAAACRRAGLDAAVTAAALERSLPALDVHTDRVLGLAASAFESAVAAAESDATSDQLAESLGQSFERADVLLSLAELVHEQQSTGEILYAASQLLREALDFDFAGVVLHSRKGLPRSLRVSARFAVSEGISQRDAERAATAILATSFDASAGTVGTFAPPFAHCAGVALTEPLFVDGKPVGALVAGLFGSDLMAIDSYHLTLAESVCGFLGPSIDNLRLREAEQRAFLGTLEALSSTLDAKDPYTRGHSERVAHLSAAIGEQLRLERADLERLHIAGRLHDIGKIGLPENVLLKPSRLTAEEFEIVKRHPAIGHEILRDVPGLKQMLPAVLHHHERWDGNGYPHGLAGEAIPLDARIMAVADTFDAMSSKRSYREGMPRDTVLAEIARCAGSQFEPRLVEAFLKVDLGEYDRLVEQAMRRESAIAGGPDGPPALGRSAA